MSKYMSKKPLRVGFDLDGVILYNPIRFARPIISFLKHKILRKKTIVFYVPKSGPAKMGWHIVHLTSFKPAGGLEIIAQLIKDKKIEPYIVTGRYASLSRDLEKWKSLLTDKYGFRNYFNNIRDEQPNAFKARMIKKLNLDVFVEDNWDIVQLLHKNGTAKTTKLFWITNILDRFLPYDRKFSNLRNVAKELKKLTS